MRRTPLALSLMLFTAGCGSSDDDRTDLKTFASRANAICQEVHQQTNRLAKPQRPADILPWISRTQAISKAHLAKLQALPLPDKKSETAQQALDLAAQEPQMLEKIKAAIRQGVNPRRALVKEVSAFKPALAQENAAWEELGASACAE